MRIVADDAIPWLDEAFGSWGRVIPLPGPAIDAPAVADADVLLVRSVTRVDAALLGGSRLRFVASATAGTDHVDLEALAARGITFAHAPGVNATAVVEYVLTALAAALPQPGSIGPIGVVGFGQIGRRLAQRLRDLGHLVLVCDPPLARLARQGRPPLGPPAWMAAAAREPFCDLDELLERCDVLTLHVPAVPRGPYATRHLLGHHQLARWPGRLLLNTARGDVVDNQALLAWLDAAPERGAILDVWEGEPRLLWPLLRHPGVRLATPHIAGYTYDGKALATLAVHDAMARWIGEAPRLGAAQLLGAPGGSEVACPEPLTVAGCLLAARPLLDADRALRGLLELPEEARGAAFERLRKGHPLAREFAHHRVPGHASGELAARLQAYGLAPASGG